MWWCTATLRPARRGRAPVVPASPVSCATRRACPGAGARSHSTSEGPSGRVAPGNNRLSCRCGRSRLRPCAGVLARQQAAGDHPVAIGNGQLAGGGQASCGKHLSALYMSRLADLARSDFEPLRPNAVGIVEQAQDHRRSASQQPLDRRRVAFRLGQVVLFCQQPLQRRLSRCRRGGRSGPALTVISRTPMAPPMLASRCRAARACKWVGTTTRGIAARSRPAPRARARMAAVLPAAAGARWRRVVISAPAGLITFRRPPQSARSPVLPGPLS